MRGQGDVPDRGEHARDARRFQREQDEIHAVRR